VSDDNIILFPADRIQNIESTGKKDNDVFKKRIQKQQTKAFVEDSVDQISMDLIKKFVDMACKTQQTTFTKDFSLLVDMMRGLLYRDFGLNHPAQRLADKMVVLDQNTRGQTIARLDYAKVLEFKSKPKKPLNKEVSEELDDLRNGSDIFEPDMDLDD
jgi:hypothetical protein